MNPSARLSDSASGSTLRTFIVVPLLLLLLAGATLITLLSYRSGQLSVEHFGRQFADEMSGRIRDHLEAFFAVPERIVRTNLAAVRSGDLDPQAREALMRRLVAQVRYSPYLSFVSIGFADGEYVGASHDLDSGEVQLVTAIAEEGMHFDTYRLGPGDTRAERIARGEPFDARTRTWYRSALEAGGPAWYPIYKYWSHDSLGMGVSAPAVDSAGRMVGVISCDLALAQIGRYLQSRPLGLDAVAFVIDAQGRLLATSIATPLVATVDGVAQPISAQASGDALIRAAAEQLADGKIGADAHGVMTVGTSRYVLRFREFKDPLGLRLHVGLLIPEAQLAGRVARNFQLAFAMMFATLIAGALLGLVTRRGSEDDPVPGAGPISGGATNSLALCAVLGVAYFLLGKLAFAVSVQHGTVTSVVFTPEGAALAFCVLFGPRVAPGIFIGQMLLTWSGGQPFVAGALIGGFNSLEGVLGSLLFWRLRLSPSLARPRDVGMLVVLIFLVLQPFSATCGVAVLHLVGDLPVDRLLESWFHWWIGNCMGQLLVAPLILCWMTRPPPAPRSGLLDLLGTGVGALVVLLISVGSVRINPFLLLAITSPLLVWVGLRHGMRGVVVGNVLILPALIVAGGAGDSILAELSLDNRIGFVSFFVATACVPSMLISALLNERRSLIEQLSEETERASAASALAHRADAAKSRLLSAASHDLRQPLQALQLFVMELRAKASEIPSPALLDSIQSACDAQSGMLNALLDMSRADAALVKPERSAFPISRVLDQIRSEFTAQARARGLQLRVVASARWVDSDPAMLERMVRNLVSNAVRYTPRGAVLVGCRGAGDTIRLEVRDSGPGIAPELQPEVFKEFVQVGNPERDHRKGLGLGLFIVDGLANALGHRLHMRSAVGVGSVISIELPAAVPGDARPQPSTPQTDRLVGKRIAVIDDEPMILEGLTRVLTSWGCTVVCGESADEVIAADATMPPDAILADYRLREQRTGPGEIGALRFHYRSYMPAALLTGETHSELLRGMAAEGFPLMLKPIEGFKLRALLSSLMVD